MPWDSIDRRRDEDEGAQYRIPLEEKIRIAAQIKEARVK